MYCLHAAVDIQQKWCCPQCSDYFFKIAKFNEQFQFSLFWHFSLTLCMVHVSIRFCSSTVTSPMLLILRRSFSMSWILRGAPYIRECHLKNVVHHWTLFWQFLSAHFWISVYSYSQAVPAFGFVCASILGYAVCIFHGTDAKYIMLLICWCK